MNKDFFKFAFVTDLLVFGINSKVNRNTRALPKKYFSILLVRRDTEPFKDMWGLPGEFVGVDEDSKDVALKILKKETGLTDVYMQKLCFKDSVNRDPRGRVVSGSYMTLVDRTLIKESLRENVSWFDVILQEINSNIIVTLTNGVDTISYRVSKVLIDFKSDEYLYKITSKNNLPFDQDELIIEGIMELRKKVKNTDIVFSLMPKKFTIGELKQVYEILLNKKLINSVFRRTIASKVVSTNEIVSTGGHRPSLLYKYKS